MRRGLVQLCWGVALIASCGGDAVPLATGPTLLPGSAPPIARAVPARDAEPAAPPAPTTSPDPSPLAILFVGNSFTQYNAMPSMIAALAKGAGRAEPVTELGTVGGATLAMLYDNPQGWPLNRVAARPWSHVVLQEHPLELVDQVEEAERYARRWVETVRAQQAQPILFLPWPRKMALSDLARMASVERDIAGALEVPVAPVGAAFARAVETLPELALYDPDGLHPSRAGSYLVALVLYGALYQVSPHGLAAMLVDDRGATLVELPPTEAAVLQEIAAEALARMRDPD